MPAKKRQVRLARRLAFARQTTYENPQDMILSSGSLS